MPNRMIYISGAVIDNFDQENNKSGLVNQLLAQHYNQGSFKSELTNHVHVKPSNPTPKTRPCKHGNPKGQCFHKEALRLGCNK